MNVLFFYPKIENVIMPSYAPLGLMSIATYLNKNGHSAVVSDRFYDMRKIEETIAKNNPDIVGISVISQTFIKDAIFISKKVKKWESLLFGAEVQLQR